MEKFPVTIYAAVTPNPNTVKFVADKMLIEPNDASADFQSRAETIGHSPLATAIFDKFPFVTGVFINYNFISITKSEAEMAWDYLQVEVKDFVWDFITNGNPIVTKRPNEKEYPAASDKIPKYAPSPLDDKIIELMKKYVSNPVQGDGGEIVFRNFKDGVVTVLLKGACVNCPARNKTLKQGIEDILKKYIPEVEEVVSESDLLAEDEFIDETLATGKSPFASQLDFSEFDSLPEV